MEKYSPQQLMEILSKMSAPQEDLPVTELRYIIYARKSTKGEEKQERSIPDQIAECRAFAEKQNLMIKSIVQEEQSAKDSGQRPKFNQMLSDIQGNKYDGIIAWHPDRLARNMKEAGGIIDLLDKKVIKDLKFPSFSFANDVDGKVMLGIAFVLAKQYSEKLGKDVRRGVGKSIAEGQLPAQTKYGYYKDETTNMLYPDGENFKLIKEAWDMRVKGVVNKQIANYINKQGFEKAVGRGRSKYRKYIVSETKLSQMFRNPFYAGINQHGDNWINLFEVYDFTPMVSIEDFLKVNSWISENQKEKLRRVRQGAIIGDYLKGFVKCNSCGKPLRPAPTTKNLKDKKQIIIFLRCMTEGCEKQNSSARAQVVDKFIQDFLENSKWIYSKTAYNRYAKEMTVFVKAKNKELRGYRATLLKKKANIERRIDQLKETYMREEDPELQKIFKEDWGKATLQLDLNSEETKNVSERIADNDSAVLGFEDFYELLKNLPTLSENIKKLSYKDKLAKILFTNLTVEIKKGDSLNSKVVGFELNSPFKELYNSEKIQSGGPGRT